MNIPIYRAKKIGSDEYVEGLLSQDGFGYYVITKYLMPVGYGSTRIDASTLAIHFPDILGSEGNKIFASLSEDGKGGDILSDSLSNVIAMFSTINGFYVQYETTDLTPLVVHKYLKVIGIKQ